LQTAGNSALVSFRMMYSTGCPSAGSLAARPRRERTVSVRPGSSQWRALCSAPRAAPPKHRATLPCFTSTGATLEIQSCGERPGACTQRATLRSALASVFAAWGPGGGPASTWPCAGRRPWRSPAARTGAAGAPRQRQWRAWPSPPPLAPAPARAAGAPGARPPRRATRAASWRAFGGTSRWPAALTSAAARSLVHVSWPAFRLSWGVTQLLKSTPRSQHVRTAQLRRASRAEGLRCGPQAAFGSRPRGHG